MSEITLTADRRTATGSGAVGRLRHTGKIPGVIYGQGSETISIELNHHDVSVSFPTRASRDAQLTLVLDGQPIKVKFQDIQRHKTRNTALHIDFMRV